MEPELRNTGNGEEVDRWLREGGIVVAASERTARALMTDFHRRRRREGLSAWPVPQIQDWQGFVRAAWEERRSDERLVLNPLQERALWADLIERSRESHILLEEPRQRMAALAADAHRLLCSYVPEYLSVQSRSGWQQDAASFSGWLHQFDGACRADKLIGGARLPLDLLGLLESDLGPRPPLLLVGFDRVLPIQRRLFDAWGQWAEAAFSERTRDVHYFRASDPESELEACVLWCMQRLTCDPKTRILVLVQKLDYRRGEIERAFHRLAGSDGATLSFEFSLGVPLSKIGWGRGALLILEWLSGALAEESIDWLFATVQGREDAGEAVALSGFMRALRRRKLERIQWTLEELMGQPCAAELPQAWMERMVQAKRRLSEQGSRTHSPLEWAALVPELLETAGWTGRRTLSSDEFQVQQRWQQMLDACASLGFDARRMTWHEFLRVLRRAAGETLFAPESQDASIQIAGPVEAAGLHADAIWFLGADEEQWPSQGATNPLLPFAVQRDAGMPHCSAQHDLAIAQAITGRVLASAPVVCFSYARQTEGVDSRPARPILDCAGQALPLPSELRAPAAATTPTTVVQDFSRIPLNGATVAGGSTVLTTQSQCPFKAFASVRLAAQGWIRAEAGLTAIQRGQLLHDILHSVWAGPPEGIRTHKELLAQFDLRAFVESHVQRVFAHNLPPGLRKSMPQRYLELEAIRLTRLAAEWLEYERARAEFTVAGTELETDIEIAGLSLHLRLDRVDKLKDDTLLVVDYKTGDVSVKSWDTPRPEDVQLPLYAVFALDRATEPLGGMVFATVRTGQCCFQGRLWDAKRQLMPALNAATALVKAPLKLEDLEDWRNCIEALAGDFVAGHANVDPREYPKTCERCELKAVCRVQEFRSALEEAEEDSDE